MEEIIRLNKHGGWSKLGGGVGNMLIPELRVSKHISSKYSDISTMKTMFDSQRIRSKNKVQLTLRTKSRDILAPNGEYSPSNPIALYKQK